MAMMIRQNATHKVVIGPVVAVANGYVPVTTLTVSGADEAEAILHDNGTVVDISGYTFAAITTADGYYHLTLQSGISGTVGHMTVVINDDSLCLPVRTDFIVVEETVYDALYTSTAPGYLQPTTAGRTLDVTAGGCAGVDWANVEAPTTTLGLTNTTVGVLTTYTGNTPQTGDSYARIGATGSGLTTLATAASLAIVAGYIDTEVADIQARLPAALVGGRMDANVGAISGDATAADNAEAFFDGTGYAGTGNTIPTVTTLTNLPAITANWLTAAGIAADAITDAKVSADVTIASVTGAVGSVTAGVTLAANAITAAATAADFTTEIQSGLATAAALADVPTVAEFEARTPTAAQLAYIVANAATGLPVTFTTSGGSTTAAVLALVDGGSPSATNDQYNGRLLVFTDGTLKGVVTDITDYVGGTTTATITAIPTAPTSSHNARLI